MCCTCGGGCFDEDDGLLDGNGYGCEYYSSVPTACGEHDTEDFRAAELCCVCMVFNEDWTEDEFDPYVDGCEDSAGGAVDAYGDGCEWYNDFHS